MDDTMYNKVVKQRGKHLADWQAALGSLDTDLWQFGSSTFSTGRRQVVSPRKEKTTSENFPDFYNFGHDTPWQMPIIMV